MPEGFEQEGGIEIVERFSSVRITNIYMFIPNRSMAGSGAVAQLDLTAHLGVHKTIPWFRGNIRMQNPPTQYSLSAHPYLF